MRHQYFFKQFLSIFIIFLNILLLINSTASGSSILLTTQTPPNLISSMKNLHATITPYPLRTVNDNGLVQQVITNRSIRCAMPSKTQPMLCAGNFSMLHAKYGDFSKYPKGSALFASYSDVASKFDLMIATMQKNTGFIPFFRKVHINVLNELYNYLMGIYTNFNLQHTGIIQTENGDLKISIPKFLNYEDQYEANKKTLIINHLINIIESQFNSAICSYTPNMPQTFATYIGKVAVQNDFSIDLTQFLEKQIKPNLIQNKKRYLQGLATYLDFFQTYTNYLLQPHPTQPNSFVAFVDIAQNINQFLYGDKPANKQAAAISKMNPPLFMFNYDDMRALQIIPYLAQSMNPKSSTIMWPSHIVQAANEGSVVTTNGQDPTPIAYFKTPAGTVVKNTSNDPNIKLFVCIRSGANLFEQELIAQPDWLNSWDGIANILRACFGDFSALIGLNILDPFMESLIQLVLAVQKNQDPNETNTQSPECKALLQKWQKSKINQPSGLVPPTPPNIPNGLPSINQPNGLPPA